MKRVLPILLSLILLTAACSSKKIPPEVVIDNELRAEVSQLFSQTRIKQARDLLKAKVDEGLTDVVLLQNYAFIEAKVFQDYDAAKAALTKALKLDPSPGVYASLAEVYFYQGRYDLAISELERALELKDIRDDQWDNELSQFYFLLGRCYRAAGDNVKAIASLEAAVNHNPYLSDASGLLHRLYVEEGNYPMAYEAWKISNYIFEKAEPLLASTAVSNNLYQAALDVEAPNHKTMAELYFSLRLYDEAMLEYSRFSGSNNPAEEDIWARVSTLVEFRDQLAAFFDEYYRERWQGGPEFNDYPRLVPIYELLAPLYGEIQLDAGPQAWVNKLNHKLEEDYGLSVSFLSAGGVAMGLHLGYVAEDLKTQVSQWGTSGDFRLVVLRNMVSNGLFRWFSNGTYGVGGWNLGDDEMYVILDSSGSILETLRFLKDGDLEEFRLRSNEEYQQWLGGRGVSELFYSPFLISEFKARQVESQRERAKNAGFTPLQQKITIVNVYQASILTNIIAHEGQHALDQNFSALVYGEYEYRAKLSELAYGDLQYYTLANLHNPTLGLDTRKDVHGAADSKVYESIVNYIAENSARFPEIDPDKNIMLQLPKLSEEQIRLIAIEIFMAQYPGSVYP